MEYLFEGAAIYTLDGNDLVAEAMVVENGLVKRVGDRAELKKDHPGPRSYPWTADRLSPRSMTATPISPTSVSISPGRTCGNAARSPRSGRFC